MPFRLDQEKSKSTSYGTQKSGGGASISSSTNVTTSGSGLLQLKVTSDSGQRFDELAFAIVTHPAFAMRLQE